MSHISLLIKPVSGSCNLCCRYCFYTDEMKNRKIALYGYMTEETLEILVRKTFEFADGPVTFGFQGGEPMLRGIEFYRTFCRLKEKYNKNNYPVNMTIQTNGTLIDKTWAKFFKKEHFLVGLSLDGPRSMHDRYRIDRLEQGTFKNVLKSSELLKEYGVEFNTLTVLTEQNAKEVDRIYNFLVSKEIYYHQYIPCLNEFTVGVKDKDYALSARTYAHALKCLFDLWYTDLFRGKMIYNRYFENLVGILCGKEPECCDMVGHCSIQYLVEADGSIYPCDFYALDEYKIGNIREDFYETIDVNRKKIKFVEKSFELVSECNNCQWKILCRGGCRRNRIPDKYGNLGLNRFCEAYKLFFPYAIKRLSFLAQCLTKS